MKTEFENNFPCLLGAQMGLNHDKKQWFRSIFIESGSGYSQKSQSGSDPVPDPNYFLPVFEKKLNYFIIIRFYHQKKSIE